LAAIPAPIGPGAGQPVEHLLGGGLAPESLLLGQRGERRLVGDRAPQERRYALLLDALEPRRHAGFPKIFLRQHVGGDLGPGRRHFDRFRPEHHGAVRIADLARGQAKFDALVGGLTFLRVPPLDPHCSTPLARRRELSERRHYILRGPKNPRVAGWSRHSARTPGATGAVFAAPVGWWGG